MRRYCHGNHFFCSYVAIVRFQIEQVAEGGGGKKSHFKVHVCMVGGERSYFLVHVCEGEGGIYIHLHTPRTEIASGVFVARFFPLLSPSLNET